MAVPAMSCLLNRQAGNIIAALPLPPTLCSTLKAFRMASVAVPSMNRSPFGTAGLLRHFAAISGCQNSRDLNIPVTACGFGRRTAQPRFRILMRDTTTAAAQPSYWCTLQSEIIRYAFLPILSVDLANGPRHALSGWPPTDSSVSGCGSNQGRIHPICRGMKYRSERQTCHRPSCWRPHRHLPTYTPPCYIILNRAVRVRVVLKVVPLPVFGDRTVRMGGGRGGGGAGLGNDLRISRTGNARRRSRRHPNPRYIQPEGSRVGKAGRVQGAVYPKSTQEGRADRQNRRDGGRVVALNPVPLRRIQEY